MGYCVRVVPSEVAEGQIEAWLQAHREHHTPAVRRQPGFISKILMQSEADPHRVVMLLTWRTTEEAQAWVAHPEHDVVSDRVRSFSSGKRVSAADRGGYRVLEAVSA